MEKTNENYSYFDYIFYKLFYLSIILYAYVSTKFLFYKKIYALDKK